ncbi:MAG: hypothetical protein AMXMBFR46_12530 [Acidimicrobiia bacterium]
MARPSTRRHRVAGAALSAVLVLAGATVALAAPAHAQVTTTPSLTVSQSADLDGTGQLLEVSGSGFDTTEGRGIYVAFCVVPPPGLAPGPCGGRPGVPGGGAAWIATGDYSVSNGGVAFGPGGTFSVQVLATPMIDTLDCRRVQCAVATRSDHRRPADRSQDVLVPVSFAGTDVRTLPIASVADSVVGSDDPQVGTRIDPITTKPKPRLPVTVRSADGRDVEVDDVSRIVSLNGSLSEIVYTLGLGDRLVGRDVTTTFKEAKKVPMVTRGHDVSAESVLSRRPSVVLAQTDSGPPDALQQIRDAGVPVVVFEAPKSVEEIGEREMAVARALGVPDDGAKLRARTSSELERIEQRVPEDAQKPRVAFLYMRGQAGVYLIGGKGSGADSMIRAAGGVDAGSAMGLQRAFTPITSEALAQAAPDVILMTTTGLRSVGGIEGLVKVPGIAQTPAAKDRRIITEEDGLLFSFGSRTPVALRRLVTKLHTSPSLSRS